MKKHTMKRLMALPKDAQEKIWQLARERLKEEKRPVNEVPRPQAKKTK